jgi:tetratricopeptide (TPR) repeat protein
MDLALRARTEAEYKQAVRLLAAAISEHPDAGRLYSFMAGLHMRFGRYDDARKDYQTIVAGMPDASEAFYNLAIACERAGNAGAAANARARYQQLTDTMIEATELKREALLHRDDPDIFIRLARVMSRAGKKEEVIRDLEQASRLRPNDPSIRNALQTIRAAGHAGGSQLPP